jgi:hypothetical protein
MKIPVPWHMNFEEVNLRFYVKRIVNGECRRGVVFVKEIVPRACIAIVAKRLFNENYVAAPMSHFIERQNGQLCVRYDWTIRDRTHSVTLHSDGTFREMSPGSQEEFIAEHYWGYCRQRDGGTIEYQVTHPKWQVAMVNEFSFACDAVALYGKELGEQLSSPPDSVFLANGSKVEVGFGQRF